MKQLIMLKFGKNNKNIFKVKILLSRYQSKKIMDESTQY